MYTRLVGEGIGNIVAMGSQFAEGKRPKWYSEDILSSAIADMVQGLADLVQAAVELKAQARYKRRARPGEYQRGPRDLKWSYTARRGADKLIRGGSLFTGLPFQAILQVAPIKPKRVPPRKPKK